MRNDVFQKIERNEFSLQELSDLFFETIYYEKKDPNGINLLYVESLLLWFYNNDRDYQDKEKLLDKDESNNLTTPIKSKLENENARTNLAQCFGHITQQWNYDTIGLNYLIKKINLTESVTIQ